MSIKLIREETGEKFEPAFIQAGDEELDATFHKDPETGCVVVVVDDYEGFPFNTILTLTVKDGNNSHYRGLFNEEGVFTPHYE